MHLDNKLKLITPKQVSTRRIMMRKRNMNPQYVQSKIGVQTCSVEAEWKEALARPL